jgi:hypothetical protein
VAALTRILSMGKEREKKEGSAREITPEMELGRRCR